MPPLPPPHQPSLSDPYEAIPDVYDLEHAAYEDDLWLYRGLAEAVGDPILELGCGSGRVLLPLAEAGWRVTGVDRSPAMLERARAAIAAQGLSESATLVEGDMAAAAMAPGGPFGLVIIALNGLMHVPTAERQRRVLEAARAALDPRGQLVIDLLNPTPDALKGLEAGVVHEGSWQGETGEQVDKFGSRRILPATQTIETRLWYDRTGADGIVRRTTTGFPLRYLHAAELLLMLEAAGFAECHVYGGYDLDPYDDGSERLIVTADPTPST